ncbi:hypothetical protein [Actinoplanes sp. URMC 104]|uniref:hypothetical protein n=1 Tax=Actinoplanes sp. URMC 104 TaxID=3423409 RepID=UPI003F1C0658
MTEDLRALLRAELDEQRPPPVGDLVGAALRDGRRIRRRRRLGAAGAGAAGALAVVLFGSLAAHSEPRRAPGLEVAAPAQPESAPAAGPESARPEPAAPGRAEAKGVAASPPGSVPFRTTAPTAGAPPRTLTVLSGDHRAAGPQKKATTGAMLHLLTELLPPGRISHRAVAGTGDLSVRLHLDQGDGPGLLQVTLGRLPVEGARPPRGDTATVTFASAPGNCRQHAVVISRWPDGTAVQMDLASCLTDGTDGTPPLDLDTAARIAADPRWGVVMDAGLVEAGAREFRGTPEFAS